MMAGKYEEALMSLLQGLSLDPNVTSAKTTLAQVRNYVNSTSIVNIVVTKPTYNLVLQGQVSGLYVTANHNTANSYISTEGYVIQLFLFRLGYDNPSYCMKTINHIMMKRFTFI